MRLQLSLLSLMIVGCASEPETPPEREVFSEMCAPYFDCSCDTYRYRDLDTCVTVHHAQFAELFGAADAAGLHTDLECYHASQTPDEDRCLGHGEYEAKHADEPQPREPGRCGECQPVYGAKQPGEACVELGVGGSDCAQGLVCLEAGVCVDPCAPTPVGEPCEWGTSICGPGRFCDFDDQVCRALAGVDESCLETECDEGLTCSSNGYCVEQAGLDERCGDNDCEDGLECLHLEQGMFCKLPPGEGEYCEENCADGLRCDRDVSLCVRPVAVGEACADAGDCESWICVDGACAAGPADGEACIDNKCGPGLECEDAVCVRETARVCWR